MGCIQTLLLNIRKAFLENNHHNMLLHNSWIAPEGGWKRFIVTSAIFSAHVPHTYEMRPFKFKDGPALPKEKILENIFTAIKYSGLEDSNKFRSHVYIVSIFIDP